MKRTYRRDARGRFARRGSAAKATKRGAVIGGALLLGGPALIPAGAAIGAGVGYGVHRARNRRR